jgi:anti-sigma factor RsiW
VEKPSHNDQQLIPYLLGLLPDDEAERLDELSVADDKFAFRLQAAEHDLIDSYVRGELSGETLEHFKSFYLSSPKRREKLAFAEALHARELRFARSASEPAHALTPQRSTETSALSARRSPWRIFSLQWSFAGAALAMALVAGFLFLEVAQLKRQITGAESERAAVDQRNQSLEKELNEQRTTNVQTQTELDRLQTEARHSGIIKSIAVLLMPQTRGTGQPVSISVPTGIDMLPLRLELESDEFPEYQVTLKAPGSDRAVWSSAKLKARSQGKNRLLSVSIPTKGLKQQTYVLQARGIPPRGTPELIDGYVFRVVLD